jgi:CMP-N-acetylneuraminic acid synthetase
MITAVVAARAGSIRLPGKALLPFGGLPLVAHKVRQLRSCRLVDRVVINSDGPAIVAAAVAAGAEAIDGKDYDGDAREMIADTCRQIGSGTVLWAHPTNPLVTRGTYAKALLAYQAAMHAGFDSLLSVMRVQRHAWFDGKPLNYDPTAKRHQIAAECTPVYFQDGAIFIQPCEQAIRLRYFFGDRPMLFETPEDEQADIDTGDDYRRALGRAQ